MKRTGSSNPLLRELVGRLKGLSRQEDTKIWARLASDLEKPTRQRRIVNISELDKNTKENDSVVVPGKVLASGTLSHKISIAAFKFSQTAMDKIRESNGDCLSIEELMKKNPKGKGLKIIG